MHGRAKTLCGKVAYYFAKLHTNTKLLLVLMMLLCWATNKLKAVIIKQLL
jgi:hypothetical protein